MKNKNCFETDEIMSGYYVILLIEIQIKKINLSLNHHGFIALSFLIGSCVCPLNLFSSMVMYDTKRES